MQSQESAEDSSLKISSLPFLQQKASHGCLQGNCLDHWPFLKHLKGNRKCHPSSKSDLVVNAGETLSFNWKAEGNIRKEWLSPFQLRVKALLIVCDVPLTLFGHLHSNFNRKPNEHYDCTAQKDNIAVSRRTYWTL